MKKLMIIFCLTFSSFASAGCLSFKLNSHDLIAKKVNRNIQLNYKKFENLYTCKESDSKFVCYGDDDRGQFTLDFQSKSINISSLTFGEPDGETLSVSKNDLKGKVCK